MIIIAKIVSIVLALVVISKSYLDFKKKRESLTMFLIWSLIWIIVVTIAVFPFIAEKAIDQLGSGRTGIGTVLGIGMVLMLYIVYRVYTKSNRIEYQLRELITKISLYEANDRKKSK